MSKEKKPALEGLRRFAQDFSQGIDRREVGRLFDEDATRAFTVLSGDSTKPTKASPESASEGPSLEQIRDFFIGMAMKLSPGRRLLFAAALLCPILGFFDFEASLAGTTFVLDFSPFWFLFGLAGMTFLLALELVDRLRVRDELEVARQLQRELLPNATPHMGAFAVAHSYRTANEIGGDYYEFLPLEDGRWVIAVGDASGHGMAAGLVMAVASASLRTAVDLDPSPASVLTLLNRVLFRTGGKRAFMTMFYGILDPRDGSLEYSNAGHPFPYRYRRDGLLQELGEGSLPLGLKRELKIETSQIQLEKNDLFVLYTDGIPEATTHEEENPFTFERLEREIRRSHARGGFRELHDRLLQQVDQHLQNRSPLDDLTLVVLERLD